MNPASPRARWLMLAGAGLLVLAAYAVRVHNLGAQSLWYDEGVAYGHSQRTLAEMIPMLQNNVHVPAYFGTLALWEDFAGHSEFSLRYLSVLFSIVGVALVFPLGRRLYGTVAGVAALAFVGFNTFHIYYAQEARMYAMLATVATASMWAFVGWVRAPARWRLALAFALLNALGMYTHFSYALVMVAQGTLATARLLALAWRTLRAGGWPAWWRMAGLYAGVNLLTIALFAPWIEVALRQTSAQPNIGPPVSFDALLRLLQGWLTIGLTFEQTVGGMGVVIYFFALFGLLTLPGQPRRAWWGVLVPVAWVLTSGLLYIAFDLGERYLRFLLPAQVGAALWLSRGVWILWHVRTRERQGPLVHVPRAVALLTATAFVGMLISGLAPLYNDPAYQRDDYRRLVATLRARLRADDAIILSSPGLREIFGYYYGDGPAPVYALPAGPHIAEDTRAIIAQHDRIFAVLYGTAEQDPNGLVQGTLNQEAYQIEEGWIDDVRLVYYVAPASFPPPQAVDVAFGPHITLVMVALNSQRVQPGDALQVQFTWRTDRPLQERYKVFLQLLNEEGVLVAQRDSEPGGGTALTTTWASDQLIVDNHALAIPDLPAGTYRLIAGLYDLDDPGQRLRVADETFYELAIIEVSPPDA